MHIPVPRNRLVALTVLGVVLTGILTVALASPAAIPTADDSHDPDDAELGRDAPEPNSDFTPDVQSRQPDDEEHEYEEYEEYGEHEEREADEEHEEREDD